MNERENLMEKKERLFEKERKSEEGRRASQGRSPVIFPCLYPERTRS